ncbi:aromatic-ring-hydroxylating dioxygenase subunit beta [Streptomyces sp. NPDC048254]|uniref:aromatic-ring-hydroxylating dioxygenase subunit beta n=1 Tax=Streptomyces sp. NPDC048254 TaxID=3365525 RepID=UPI0037143799
MTTVANTGAEASGAVRPAFTPVDPELAAFIYLEARLADESRYSEWEALWDDDACYWVPMREGDDPQRNLSYIYDNRRRLRSRIAQLNTGSRHAQTPPSRMRRTVSNLEVLAHEGDLVTIGSNFALHEYRHELTVWAGRYVHRIRTGPDGPRLVEKTVHLVNGHGAVPTLAFLI